jgi:hypothetical protein
LNLDRLENVESGFRSKVDARLITIGLSKHLFTALGSVLLSKFDYIDFSFHENEALFNLVDTKKIDFAIVTSKYDTLNTVQKKAR